MQYSYSTFSDKGPSAENQDALHVSIHAEACIACIADGVGSAARGGAAATMVTKFFVDALEANISANLTNVVEAANAELLNEPDDGLVTTFSGVVIQNLLLRGVHAGDTRVYVLRGNGIKQLTEDHTEYFRFFKEGKLTAEEAETYPRKHVLENALGSKASPRIDSFSFEMALGDRVLLTTDGVHTLLSKLDLRDISKASSSATDMVNNIVNYVQDIKPTDNYSVSVIEIS